MYVAPRSCPLTQCDPCAPIPCAEDFPPYIPDLAPADFFPFPRMKAAIKGAHFADVNAIKDRVTAVLRSIPQESFADYYRKLYVRCQTCVVEDGNYFEGQ